MTGLSISQSTVLPWVLAARPKTLPAAAVPVLLAGALAAQLNSFQLMPFMLCLGFSLLIQIGTNYANDYYDFVKGADTESRIGPKRAVASGWILPTTMHKAMIGVFTSAIICGLFLIPFGGIGLLWVGVLSVLCGIAYTGGPYPLGYNGLGDLFVFIFFGLVAVGVTFYLQLGLIWSEYLPAVAALAVAAGALATAILAVNNYRDEPTDKLVGKRTLAVRFGRKFVAAEYRLLLLGAQSCPLVLWWYGFAAQVLLPLLLLPLSIWLSAQLTRRTDAAGYVTQLAGTALLLTLFGLLQAVGLLWA